MRYYIYIIESSYALNKYLNLYYRILIAKHPTSITIDFFSFFIYLPSSERMKRDVNQFRCWIK